MEFGTALVRLISCINIHVRLIFIMQQHFDLNIFGSAYWFLQSAQVASSVWTASFFRPRCSPYPSHCRRCPGRCVVVVRRRLHAFFFPGRRNCNMSLMFDRQHTLTCASIPFHELETSDISSRTRVYNECHMHLVRQQYSHLHITSMLLAAI